MRNLWKPSNPIVYIGSKQAIELKTIAFGHENLEHCLSSVKGEIWRVSDHEYSAVIFSVSKSKNAPELLYKRFGKEKLESYIEKLEIDDNPRNQTPSANFFAKNRG